MADDFFFQPGWLQSVINGIAPPAPDLPGILGAYANPAPLPGIPGAYGTAPAAPGLSGVMDQINASDPVLPAASSYTPGWQTPSLTSWQGGADVPADGTPPLIGPQAAAGCSFDGQAMPVSPAGASGAATQGSSLDVDKFSDHMDAQALPKTIKQCAQFVRQGIAAGGVTVPNTKYAGDYGPNLMSSGFTPMAEQPAGILDNTSDYQPQKGDVAVFEIVKGVHDDGHMAMFDGKQWVSDFRQNHYSPYSGNPMSTPASTIYRFQGR